jgi:cysteine-rich repeat protein
VAAVESKTPDACCPSGSTSIGDPDCAPVCGNQVLEAGEVCDDGNTRSGDGCSASCKPDDDTTTPGDDRAGYVTCNNGSSCAPDSRCCSAPTTGCVPPGGSCQLYTPQCDGPEDCPDGKPCMASMVGRSCGSSGFAYVCHTDKDCVSATCSGSGTPCRRCDAMSSSCSSGS